MSLKSNVHTLIRKYFIAKNANYYLTTQGCHKPSICKKPQYLQSAIKGGMPVLFFQMATKLSGYKYLLSCLDLIT